MIDRRMINKFLVNYLKHSSDQIVKQQMLEAMSKVLVFSVEEKEMLGIVKKEVLETNVGSENQKLLNKGFSDTLINFLLDDEDD